MIIAHLLGDFVFQSEGLINLRLSGNLRKIIKGNIKHSTIHSIISLILISYYLWSYHIIWVALFIFFIHGVIDIVKSLLTRKYPSLKYSMGIFFVDQIIHLSILYSVAHYISTNQHTSPILDRTKEWVETTLYVLSNQITFNEKLLLCILLVIIGLWGVGIFIRIFVDVKKNKPFKKAMNMNIIIPSSDNRRGVQDGGFLIGILERIVIIGAVVTNHLSLIGFLITAKSIARFKKFDDDNFVEYFIIGSLISMISAIIIGILIKEII
jgi:hypothetical protein